MSSIRRQSIISSVVIYIGFAVGLLNTYLFAKEGIFLDSQFGLYNAFIAIATIMMAFANLAMPSFIYKFYPYYKEHAGGKKNDLLTLAITISIIGFILVIIAGFTFKELIVRKYGTNAPEIVTFYNWIFPLGLGLTVYTILEAYAWQLQKSVFTNYLKEVQWRLFTTVLIILFATGIISSFDLFIQLFAFSYPFIAVTLLLYLLFTGKINFTFKLSKVTRRFSKSIVRLCAFVYGGTLIFTISQVFDSLLISSVLDDALSKLAVYSVGQSIVAMIQVPQRGIIAASISHLSQAWKDKNMSTIQRIYQRSSINQLLFACGLFSLIILSFTDAVTTFNLKGTYLNAYYVVILLGFTKIIDMGTGVNAQIIGTSTYWRFEMLSGVALLLVMLPSNYFLTKEFDITGTALANLISISVYNAIRIIFLWKKFKLFPFTMQSLYTVLLAAGCYGICYFAFMNIHGFGGMFLRSIAFIILYVTGAIGLRLSPDIPPVIQTIKKKIGIRG
ncbi:polysaccharide biosynthesis protein [Chitinophagaceae bacterium IBVUCB2]|nr:polysaccharide biosynthesis protein [Chitinophagaceae bacterium IBVUCB2]